MGEWLQVVGLFLLSSTKFLFAPGTVTAAGYSYWQTILITTLGGWFGVLVFFFFGRILVELIMRSYFKKRPKKIKSPFTYTNKLIVRTKIKYGIIGLALITPVTLSIPIGSILAARYFSRERWTIPILMFSVIMWSFILTTVSVYFKGLVIYIKELF